ncbi:hypothetical protein OHT77_25435 [Streptomyces sp. NBC_00252]|uniref:hypothetical protein n=1 Tax=Streptomyces sp. NBC_00252 TaxID=2975691 RepID=UPI002E2E1CF6|nr:hypothetical protein [Streptomyces sp. NBC_00252]
MVDPGDAGIVVRVLGRATFLGLPKLVDGLDGVEGLEASLPRGRGVRLELGGLGPAGHACAAALEGGPPREAGAG